MRSVFSWAHWLFICSFVLNHLSSLLHLKDLLYLLFQPVFQGPVCLPSCSRKLVGERLSLGAADVWAGPLFATGPS